MSVPVYLPSYVLAGSVGMTAAILLGLRHALTMAEWPRHNRGRVARIAAVVLIGWFGVAITLGSLGVYGAAADRIPTIQYGILVPILLGGGLLWRSSTVARLLEAVPPPWVVGVQCYRVLGVIFLILYGAGQLPGLFAWPAGLGDVLVGVLAPVVATAYARGPREKRDLVAAWNIFGLVDLVVAVTTGFLTAPSPVQFFAFVRPNELISAFPLLLIPTYLVPASVLLHMASLVQLHRTVPRAAAQPESVPLSA